MAAEPISAEIFRAYDIRGVVGDTLTAAAVEAIGRAFAAEALAGGQGRTVVGGDGRCSTPRLRAALVDGLRQGGLDVMDVGTVPTPLVYYATHLLETGTGVMITGSHNAPEYNGLKMMIGGATLAAEHIQALRSRIVRGDFSTGAGSVAATDVTARYVDEVVADVQLSRPLKVVVDCGNGAAGAIAPRLLAALGCEVVPLFTDIDGTFPNHHPDPAEAANLADLIATVQAEQADVGLAFDGDGDRLGVVANNGDIIWPDRAMMLFAEHILQRHPGAKLVFDVKCSRQLPALVRARGGEPVMCKTGHSHIKAKLRESGAVFGGEFSGHLCFADRWYGFDDALYSAARLLEILASEAGPAAALFARYPATIATPEIKIPTTEGTKFEVVAALANCDFPGGTIDTIDGVGVEYADSWGLVRPSNTSPVLSLRFEADDAEALLRIQETFAAALQRIDPRLDWPRHAPADQTPGSEDRR